MRDKKGFLSFLNVDSILDNLSGYLEKKIALFKLEMKEEMAQASAKLVILSILALSVFMIILFVSIAAAVFINQWLHSEYLGFLIVAGMFLVAFIIFAFFKDILNIRGRLEDTFRNILDNTDKE